MLYLLPIITLAAAPSLTAPTPSPLLSISAEAKAEVDLMSKGKEAVVQGDGKAALAAFIEAHEKSPSLETEIWVLRAKMMTGALDEAFDRIIELESKSESSAVLSYGIGAVRYSIGKREESRRGGNPGAAYEEAVAYLEEATAADAAAFPDAWLMLAESARWMGKQELAATSIDRALEVAKTGPTLALASKIRVALGVTLMADEATKDKGKRSIEQGVADAAAAVKSYGGKKEMAAWSADSELQRAIGLLYLERKDDAANAYVEAAGWDPTQVDYAQLMGTFTDADGTLAPFVDVLERGGDAFEKRWGTDVASDAGLKWWLGYAQQRLGRNEECIESMQAAVQKFPAYSNAHWFIAVSHYNLGEESYPDAVASWRVYADADAAGFAAMVNAEAINKYYLQKAQAVMYGDGRPKPSLENAAELSELLLLADTSDPDNWNNVGLMHRDAGAYVETQKPKDPMMSGEAHFERAWEAYQKSIDLKRASYYVNDAAVILHYYLERDYDRAIAMYDEAEALAGAELTKGGLSKDNESRVKIALRDAKDNRAKLKAKIERQKKKKDGEAGGGDGSK